MIGLKILAWLFGGKILQTVAAVGLATVLAGAAGYVKGRLDGSDAATVANLRAQLEHAVAEKLRRERADAEAAKLAEAQVAAEALNTSLEGPLNAKIDAVPTVPNCVPAAVLDGLRGLR